MSIKCTSLQNFDIIVCNKFVAHLGETFFMITIYYRYLGRFLKVTEMKANQLRISANTQQREGIYRLFLLKEN